MTIFHITKKETWEKAKELGEYRFCALETDGFIHCSTKEQFPKTAKKFFKGQTDLLLLEIDESKVLSKIVYENLEGGDELFPHIYGPIPLQAIIEAHDLDSVLS